MGRTFQNHKITRIESLHTFAVCFPVAAEAWNRSMFRPSLAWALNCAAVSWSRRFKRSWFSFAPPPLPPFLSCTPALHLELRLSCTGLPNCQTMDSAVRCMQRLLKRIAELTLSWLTKHCSFKYGVVVSTVASKQVGHGFDSTGCLGPFIVEFACSHWSRWLALAVQRQ